MNRKDDHINLALSQELSNNDFDKIRFIHHALSNASYNDCSLKTSFLGFSIDLPIYINAMTGGTPRSHEINTKLAKFAKHFNIPIASGSLSIALKDSKTIDSFTTIRDNYKDGIVIANIGADKTLEEAKKAISIIKADILQIHLNIVQEMIMPEGDRSFANLENNIKEIVKNIDVPVIIKEVGFGISYEVMNKLKAFNVKCIDVSGKGGTNFASIENMRRSTRFSDLNNFGLSTVESLLEATKVKDIDFLASGGINKPMDVIKALALGAKAVGMSGYFLRLIENNDLDTAIKIFEDFIVEMRTIITILGKSSIEELRSSQLLIDVSLVNYIKQRGIDLNIINNR
ncbi:MAG: type 2 isopentenyl-diphosphate Delta-isomerase [Bacilli bacterium]